MLRALGTTSGTPRVSTICRFPSTPLSNRSAISQRRPTTSIRESVRPVHAELPSSRCTQSNRPRPHNVSAVAFPSVTAPFITECGPCSRTPPRYLRPYRFLQLSRMTSKTRQLIGFSNASPIDCGQFVCRNRVPRGLVLPGDHGEHLTFWELRCSMTASPSLPSIERFNIWLALR